MQNNYNNHINGINRFTVGFDSLFNDLQRHSNLNTYPPHNIVKIDDTKYLLEFAVAGFEKEDISIMQEDGMLLISGFSEKDDREYVHRGISARNFENKFRLAEFVEVMDAKMENGLLIVNLEKIVPEELQPRKIDVK